MNNKIQYENINKNLLEDKSMKNAEMKKNELEKADVLNEYAAQTGADEDVHFEHVDWTYNDSSCCC